MTAVLTNKARLSRNHSILPNGAFRLTVLELPSLYAYFGAMVPPSTAMKRLKTICDALLNWQQRAKYSRTGNDMLLWQVSGNASFSTSKRLTDLLIH